MSKKCFAKKNRFTHADDNNFEYVILDREKNSKISDQRDKMHTSETKRMERNDRGNKWRNYDVNDLLFLFISFFTLWAAAATAAAVTCRKLYHWKYATISIVKRLKSMQSDVLLFSSLQILHQMREYILLLHTQFIHCNNPAVIEWKYINISMDMNATNEQQQRRRLRHGDDDIFSVCFSHFCVCPRRQYACAPCHQCTFCRRHIRRILSTRTEQNRTELN